MRSILLFTLLLTTLLAACNSSTKKKLGLEETLPDENQVAKAKPLEIPPHFNPPSSSSVNTHQQKNFNPKKNLTESEKALIEETGEL